MSKRQQVFEFISSQKAGKDGWVEITNRLISEELHMSMQEVQQIVGSLKNTGNIETRLVDGRVQAIRIVKAPSMWRRVTGKAKRGARRVKGARASEKVVAFLKTPNIDQYGHAKQAFETLIADESVKPYIQAEWKPDPTAEEGLTLKNQLQAATERLSILQEKYDEEHRANEYFRKTRDATFQEALKDSGVVHGDQRVPEAATG